MTRAMARLSGQSDVGRDGHEGGHHEGDVPIELDAELGRAAVDVLAIDSAGERLVLELLAHRRRLQPRQRPAGPHEGLCWPLHLSMDFFENTQLPLCS